MNLSKSRSKTMSNTILDTPLLRESLERVTFAIRPIIRNNNMLYDPQSIPLFYIRLCIAFPRGKTLKIIGKSDTNRRELSVRGETRENSIYFFMFFLHFACSRRRRSLRVRGLFLIGVTGCGLCSRKLNWPTV